MSALLGVRYGVVTAQEFKENGSFNSMREVVGSSWAMFALLRVYPIPLSRLGL
jgi:hypothetical protein